MKTNVAGDPFYTTHYSNYTCGATVHRLERYVHSRPHTAVLYRQDKKGAAGNTLYSTMLPLCSPVTVTAFLSALTGPAATTM